ncbi:pleckstrin homology domain-containing family J member 1-like [Macrobrachium rosenbergii]|uniref:pleckstrin homology domain-containing family J member 1-like n=1 Tax=Macrobrachium rosenbergii TaxID=79674 RepID=UPI0034D4E8D0
MRFNSSELIDFALPAGEQEGRLTHKPPPRTLYDTAFKERWFKLRANCLFYYRLNEFGGVDKNEPSGVFILENCEVKREADADAPFGFTIQWKDDPERKHMFFAQNEQSVHTWVSKIVKASYEHLRAQLIMLRVQIRRKTGKDPLEQFGTPLPQRASWSQELQHARSFEGLCVSSQTSASRALSVPPGLMTSTSLPDTKLSLPSRSPGLFRKSPVPPPRREKRLVAENGVPGGSAHGVGRHKASFKSHVFDSKRSSETSEDCDKMQVHKPKSSFVSHINE